LRHAAKGPPFHSGPLATYRNGPVSSNVRHHTQHHLWPSAKTQQNLIERESCKPQSCIPAPQFRDIHRISGVAILNTQIFN
jgi:hypothetical protein